MNEAPYEVWLRAEMRAQAEKLELALVARDRVEVLGVAGVVVYELPLWREHPWLRLRVWWLRRRARRAA